MKSPINSAAKNSTNLRRVRINALSLSVTTGAYGLSFGALAIASGLSLAQTMVLSLLLFSGGSQFAIVGVLGAGGGTIPAVTTSTLLGVRNGVYGLQVRQFLGVSGWRRLIAAHFTIDESTAMGMAGKSLPEKRMGFWWTGLGVWVLWNALTFVGALVGQHLGDPRVYGLDTAAGAAFLALLWPRLQTREGQITALLAAIIALAFSPFAPAGTAVLATILVAIGVGYAVSRMPSAAPGQRGER